MDTQQPLKGFIESPLYEKNKDKITQDTKLLDEILNGVTFSIAAKPDAFPLVDSHGTRTAKTEKKDELSGLTIYFKLFDDNIILIDIEETAEETPF